MGHSSTVVIYGAASLSDVTQVQADESIDYALKVGINHFDVAASYGVAEERMGPWMKQIRKQIFLATKTDGLTRDEAWREIEQSLRRLQVDSVDLEQLHEVNSLNKLDQLTSKNGGLQALIEAKEQGLIHHIGITGHGHDAPAVHLEALRRFPFESVLSPFNFVLYANVAYRQAFDALVMEVQKQDVGLRTIKAVARGTWGGDKAYDSGTQSILSENISSWEKSGHKNYSTWYRPFDDDEHIQQCVSFVLSHSAITGFASAGDIRLLPQIVKAAENYRKMSTVEQNQLMQTADQFASPFGAFSH
jgi:aryl-alcohol dehydrogenase-like predicted oxidoreductase